MTRTIICLALSLLYLPTVALAQGQNGAANGSAVSNALKVFLDCQDRTPCYSDYVKTELSYVDYVNVREAADVHVLVTSQGTGAGGREFTMKFVGLGGFNGVDDEVLFSILATDTEELARRGFVRTLKLGLVRYALHTGLGSQLTVTHTPLDVGQPTVTASRSGHDPWNYWVFRTRLNTNADTESSSTSSSFNGSFSANRTTEAWKMNVSAFQDYRKNKYTYSDGSTYTSIRRGYDATGQLIKSLTDHWSAGGKAFISGSTYENKDRAVNASAAIEYNFFRYADSTRRQFTLQYVIGVTAFDYMEETVYGKLTEAVSSHMFRTSFDMKQTWGSLSADLDLSQYLHNRSFNKKTLSVEADVRLFKGFALNVNARTSSVHDQIYLPKGEASDEEVLARQRQLETSYRHSIRVGISYTFGSIYSNVVNTRLSNLAGGGGEFRF